MKRQFFKWLLISLVGMVVLSEVMTYLTQRQMQGQIYQDLEKGLKNASQEYLTNYIDAATLRSESFLDRANSEVQMMGHLAQYLLDHRKDFLALSQTNPGKKLFDDALKYDPKNNWWQNSKSEASVVSGFGHILDRKSQIPAQTREHIRLTGLLDPLFSALMTHGLPKQWLYVMGPVGGSYIRVHPWSDIANDFEKKYPGQNKTDFWKFFFPGIVHFFESRLSHFQSSDQFSQTVWTPPYDDAAASGYTVTLFRPLWNQARTRFEGATALNLNIEHIVDFVRGIRLQQSGFAFLATDRGNIIAISDQGRQVLGVGQANTPPPQNGSGVTPMLNHLSSSRYPSIRHLTEALNSSVNLQSMQLEGDNGPVNYEVALKTLKSRWLLRDRKVEKSSWIMGLMVPSKEVFTSLAATQVTMLNAHKNLWLQAGVVLLISVLFAALISTLLSKRLTSNIEKLVHVTEDMMANDFSVRVDIQGQDEIGSLAKSFNGMAEQIERRQKSLIESEQRAIEASQAKSEFLATMSHEIRTPLNAVMGAMQLLESTKLDEKQRRYLDIYSRASETLTTVINDILDLSRIESGRVKVSHQPFDLEETVKKAFGLLLQKANEKKLQYSYKIDPDIPKSLVGDSCHLCQVLVNLLSNAIKFTEKGSVELNVSPSLVEEDSLTLRFSVKDTGIGIAADKLESVFEKFKQGQAFINRKYGGSGLGLAISKRLVELMNGKIHVTSVEGQGSHFVAHIPFDKGHAQVKTKPIQLTNPAVHRQPHHRPKILLAEDNRDNRILVELFLADQAFDLTSVENGEQAVRLFEQQEFDGVLMDIQMPVMDGYTASMKIREVEKKQGRKKTPIIALTAHATPEVEDKVLAAGADQHLSKPIDRKQLVYTLQELV